MKARPRNASALRRPPALVILALPALACAAQPAATPSSQALAACASITDSAERLACYDRLVGRGAAPAAPAPSAAPAQPAVAPAPAAAAMPAAAPARAATPVQNATPEPSATPAPSATPGSNAVVTPPPPVATAPAPSSPQSFGLYSAEHPKVAVSRTLEASVVSLGKSRDDRMTVTLDGGASWELLDDGDPLLAVGDTVTITRAALGSYLMHTPTKRTHRVRRLD
jgi:hypothetical protein